VERIKKNYNKELEEFRDKLQQQQKTIQFLTDKALYVTRAQFDTEFTAIKEVSQRLGKVMLAFKKIHPIRCGRGTRRGRTYGGCGCIRGSMQYVS